MKKGDFVRVDYIGKLESGEIFDLTDEEIAKKEKVYDERLKYKPVPVIVGEGFLIPGLDKTLENMKVGDKKTVEVNPEEGFGQRDPNLVKVIPKKEFEGRVDPKPGMVLDFSNGIKGKVQSVEAGRVRVDFNNPLAGKILKYDISVKEEITDSKAKVNAILEFFGADKADVEIKEKEVDIKLRMPDQLKAKVSSLIIDHMKGIEKVNFVDTYGKRS